MLRRESAVPVLVVESCIIERTFELSVTPVVAVSLFTRERTGADTFTAELPFVLALLSVRTISVVVPVTFRMEATAPEVLKMGAILTILPE